VLASRTPVVPSPAGAAVAPRWARTATVAVAASVGAILSALVLGIFGSRRLLRPGGQEEFVQVEFVIR